MRWDIPCESRPRARAAGRAPRHADAATVRWRFRGAILDRLDEYFECIDRIRAFDLPAFASSRGWDSW